MQVILGDDGKDDRILVHFGMARINKEGFWKFKRGIYGIIVEIQSAIT